MLCASSPSVSCTFARRLSSAFSAIITSSTVTAPAPRLAICVWLSRAAFSSWIARASESRAEFRPARVDRVDGDVGAIRFADRRLEHLLEVLGHDQALGEVDQRLASGQPRLRLDQREHRVERRLPLLLPLDAVGEAQAGGDDLRHLRFGVGAADRGGIRARRRSRRSAGGRFGLLGDRLGFLRDAAPRAPPGRPATPPRPRSCWSPRGSPASRDRDPA